MIKLRNIKEDHRDTFTIQYYGATTFTDRTIGIVPCACELIKVQEVHTTASADAGAVTLMLERLRHTETAGYGNDLLSSTINLKGTAATVQTGVLISASQDKTTQPFVTKFLAGDRIGMDITGTTGTLAGMTIICTFRKIDDAEFIVSNSLSPSTSPSASTSPSVSKSPSKSPSISPSVSPSTSPSQSLSPSVSPSTSPSVSLSPSKSPSLSPSVSPSISPSTSPSVSLSPSISPSTSPSVSLSPSVSPSTSPSVSLSPSISPSLSVSKSPSLSPSVSPSKSPSISPTVSPSLSPSEE